MSRHLFHVVAFGLIWSALLALGGNIAYGTPPGYHSADYNPANWVIGLPELLRLIQFYNSGEFHVQSGTADGYAPGAGSHAGTVHDSDYNPQNWKIGLPELLRLIQFYNSGGYHAQPGTADGYDPGFAPDLSFLDKVMNGTVRVVDYTPRGSNPTTFPPTYPTRTEIAADMKQLYDRGFRGITTYDVYGTLAVIPEEAQKAGFEIIGVGIWDITNQEIVDRAIGLKDYATFYAVGSEGLLRLSNNEPSSYTLDQLEAAMRKVRQQTHKAVTTAEPAYIIMANFGLVDYSDFVGTNIFGWWERFRTPWDAARRLSGSYGELVSAVQQHSPGKKVIVRETGFPTGAHPAASVLNQVAYFQAARDTGVPFMYLEAYDQPWKVEPCDGYNIGPTWGLYDKDGNLKSPGQGVMFTYVPAKGTTNELLKGIVTEVDRTQYSVVVYIVVDGQPWIKPYYNTLTPIMPDGTWSADIVTGGTDEQATEIQAYVVSSSYAPLPNTPPLAGEYLAKVVAVR